MSWQNTTEENNVNGGARTGVLQTRRGVLHTPFFMPDATRGTVRGLTPEDIERTETPALVVNTYHLFLQPGPDLVAQAGGIHSFMHWDKPVLSDSGGYQVFSLIHKNPELGKITEEGAEFRVPTNGDKKLLTPEHSIQVQFDLGVDMMVCLDDPRPNDIPYDEMAESVERTIRWAKRCKEEFERQIVARGQTDATRPILFGVVQGGKEKELRTRCAEALTEIGFDGYGFGGRHVDEEGNFLTDIVAHTASVIPETSVRFALGVGKPEDVVRFHEAGWDMFDCVIPTREGRHGRLFINLQLTTNDQQQKEGIPLYDAININNEKFKEDFQPVDENCDCELCTHYTRAYLRHLFVAGESLAGRLASVHNLRFYLRMMQKLRNE
jgi:queuine tRNA-ribosyltransferase